MKFIKGVLILFSTKVSLFLLGTIINIIIARLLGPTGKGIYTLAILMGSMLFTFGNLGITSGVVYLTGKGEHELKQIASNVLTIGLIIGIILSCITIIIVNTYSVPFIKGVDPVFITIVVTGVPFTLTGSYLASILLGRQEVGVFSLMQIIERIFFLVIFFGLIFVLTDKLILNAVIANLSSVIAGWIIAIILVSRRTRIGLCLQRSFVALITKYGTKVYVANMMIFGERKLDVFIINFFLNPTMVGYYSLATGIAEFLRYIPKSVSMMLFPKIASSSTTDANVYTPIVCRHMLFITAICCIGIGLISKMIIKFVYGDAFLPAAPVVWVFLPGMIFFSLSRVLLSDLLGRGKPIYGTIASSISAISSICFNFLLIPIWGMFGAAAAAVLSYFLMFVILLWFYLKVSGNKLIDMFWFAKEDFIVYINIIREILKRSRILKRNEEKD